MWVVRGFANEKLCRQNLLERGNALFGHNMIWSDCAHVTLPQNSRINMSVLLQISIDNICVLVQNSRVHVQYQCTRTKLQCDVSMYSYRVAWCWYQLFDFAGIEQKPKQTEQPIVLRKRRERIKSEANWKMFYYQFAKDHAKPNLIWNLKVRIFCFHLWT